MGKNVDEFKRNKPTIEQFILNFKRDFNSRLVEDIFLNGNCYHFAMILNNLYKGNIMYDLVKGHFMFKVIDKYYDITGEVQHIDLQNIIHYDILFYKDIELFKRIQNDCVFKNQGGF